MRVRSSLTVSSGLSPFAFIRLWVYQGLLADLRRVEEENDYCNLWSVLYATPEVCPATSDVGEAYIKSQMCGIGWTKNAAN